jgi:predicted transcriptional regulator
MKALLSIKPVFAELIFEGSKKYEFRKLVFKHDVKTIVVYASSPVKKVIGEFEVEYILTEDIKNLWKKTKTDAGISKEYFLEYFYNKEIGHAIKIKNAKLYKKPKCLKQDYNLYPPQSFLYL